MVGLEPTSSKEHRILSAARLPIPPHPDLGGKMRFELTPSWATTMRSTVKLLTTSIFKSPFRTLFPALYACISKPTFKY